MPRLRLRNVFLPLCAITGAWCASPPPGPPPGPPPEVAYAGCSAVLVPGPICVLGAEREIRLWVGAAPEARIEIRAGGRRVDARGEPVRDGRRFVLTMPAGAAGVSVLVDAGSGGGWWSLPLAEPAAGPAGAPPGESSTDLLRDVQERLMPADRDIRRRNLAAAHETLAGLCLPPKAPAESVYNVTFYRGLLAEREGDFRSALAEVQKAVEIAEQVKLERPRWLAEQMMGLLLLGVGRFGEAGELFDRLRRAPHSHNSCEDAQLLSNLAWARLLAREAGKRAVDPTLLFEQALKIYSTCKRVTAEDQANVLINLALAHLQEGRLLPAKEALARAREVEPRPPIPHALWWVDLEGRIALREARLAEALSRFSALEELAVGTSSPDGRLRAALGQARSRQALGDDAAALRTLADAAALVDGESLRIPIQEGRVNFMATQQAVVSLHLEILLEKGRNAGALNVARRARSRLLRQLEHDERLARLTTEQRGRWEQLLREYQEKRAVLQERAKENWRVPIDQRRHGQAVRQAETEAANRVLDRAFLVLSGPGEEPREAPPLRAGELLLAYHPLSTGWVGFASDGSSVEVHRFELPADALARPDELARRLLVPFHDAIARATRIRVLPGGVLQGVDFHALPFDRGVLLESAPVVYGLDLPVLQDRAPAVARTALLVADPRGDLPGALDEARAVREVLRSGPRPWVAEELKQAAASAESVRGRLAASDLLHYAGHGTFSGFGGWDSSLLLADESQLTLGDLLALERVPAWVVLSSCDSARSSNETPVESLGLAHAFLLAGSRAVVASTRPADDRKVPELFVELYRRWDREPDLAVALQSAQLAWRRRDPGADWASFRIFEP